MHDLRLFPLNIFYDFVIGTNPLACNLPPFACYECAALVKKFYNFRQKCLRNQDVLNGITNIYGKLNPREVRAINRKECNISSNLVIVRLESIDTTCNITSNEFVKLEPEDCEEDKVKVEDHNYASIDHVEHNVSSDDDEPLSIHKEKKLKNKESDEEMFEDNFDCDEVKGNEEDAVEEKKVKKLKKKHRKNGRSGAFKHVKMLSNPSLSADNMDDFDQYITVITLTVEEQKAEVMKRKESSNYLNSPFQCNLCYKGFIDNNAWNHHVSKHSEAAGSLECDVCKFRFKTKRAYQKHASGHEKRYACKSCPYVSTNTTQAKQHQGWHKGVTFKCKYCNEIFNVWTSYMSHTRIKHPSEFICGVCGYSFISKLGLAMHKTMMHKDLQEKPEENTEDGPYCAECDVKFVSSVAYKRHMVMSVKHTQSTDSIKGCRTCGATFENAESLRHHHRKEHTRKRPKNYGKKPTTGNWPAKCEHCEEEIPSAREYWTHFRRVHPDKPYPVEKNHVCDICGKSFRGNAFLVYHKRTHSAERLYKCTQCDKSFYNRSNLLSVHSQGNAFLVYHKRTHSAERLYKCTQCDKSFYNRSNLHVHEKTHSAARPYPCTMCTRAFKSKGALSRHFRTHTGQKPYECEVCGKGFSQSNSRKLHVRTVHLKQPAPYISRSRLERRKQEHKEPTNEFIF
ncbi:hypothetical protein SFRURICE_012230 [Spodoptera frugiperda]|nr:hypothetical protein SFRURICE_012230 [Spodoptera frugiperda]